MTFADPLYLQEVDDAKGRASEREGRVLWKLMEPLIYDDGKGIVITVPVGFVTDLASIPQPFWSLGFGPMGRWNRPAVVHDYLYSVGGRLPGGPTFTRARADKILDQAMAACGVPAWRRAVIWAAVRIGGSGGWAKT